MLLLLMLLFDANSLAAPHASISYKTLQPISGAPVTAAGTLLGNLWYTNIATKHPLRLYFVPSPPQDLRNITFLYANQECGKFQELAKQQSMRAARREAEGRDIGGEEGRGSEGANEGAKQRTNERRN
ncbi:hypothetical protein BZA77DRAFT_376666 [Pyronema omphalodes]|nr:hypothetical protein BZA77DRAFT_376666 [Pyronema omphalodes]